MTQGTINWSSDVALPIAGKTPAARHASASGAQQAAKTRGAVALAYRQLLIDAGPLSDVEAARVLGRALSSICSTRNDWGEKVAPSGQFEIKVWGGGGTTKRVRWQWVGER